MELAAAQPDGVRDHGNTVARAHSRDDLVDERLLQVAMPSLEHDVLE